MSALNSNLSSSGYTYDLVSTMTQDSLNANLKALLGTLGSKGIPAITAFYSKETDPVTGETTVNLLSADEAQSLTGGYDVFSIPNNTTNQNSEYADIIVKLATAGFAYAFEVTIGLPPEIPAYDLPDILILDPKNPQWATYYSYYQSFKIIELSYISFGVAQIVNLSQDTYGPDSNSDGIPDKDPWVFEWQVCLNLAKPTTTAFGNLPIAVQKNLEAMNYNTNTMFSMQQLLLDLNSPRLTNGASPEIFNFIGSDAIYSILDTFITNYWEILQNNGEVVFNTAIKPVAVSDYPPSSIVPTAVNFVVSQGANAGLNTLNYLIMTDERSFPSPIVPFDWSWVDSDKIQGIMSVRKSIFVDYLNKALSPALANITYYPTVDVDMDGHFKLGLVKPNTAPTYNSNPNNPVLTFEWDQKDSDDAGLFGAIYHANVKTTTSSNVVFSGNTIICTTILTFYVDIYTALATTKGFALATKNVTTFTMNAVGASQTNGGILSISSASTDTNLVQNDDKNAPYYGGNLQDPSLWSQGITLGAINDYIDTVNEMTSKMSDLMNGFEDSITNICTNCLGWTFPGAGTYYFSDPQFSNNNDLTVQIAVQSIN